MEWTPVVSLFVFFSSFFAYPLESRYKACVCLSHLLNVKKKGALNAMTE